MRVLHDVTRPVREATPVWPGDAPFRLCWTAELAAGGANVGEIHGSTHCGTHVDAPFHVLGDGARVGALPLEAFLGPALVVDARGRAEIGTDDVATLLRGGPVERVLFRTGCWVHPDRFPERFPALTPEAADRLVAAGVRLVGTDAPSVDPFDSATLPAHRVLARAGVPILENLLLDGVPAGVYRLVALPLRLVDGDASPVRAVLAAP